MGIQEECIHRFRQFYVPANVSPINVVQCTKCGFTQKRGDDTHKDWEIIPTTPIVYINDRDMFYHTLKNCDDLQCGKYKRDGYYEIPLSQVDLSRYHEDKCVHHEIVSVEELVERESIDLKINDVCEKHPNIRYLLVYILTDTQSYISTNEADIVSSQDYRKIKQIINGYISQLIRNNNKEKE